LFSRAFFDEVRQAELRTVTTGAFGLTERERDMYTTQLKTRQNGSGDAHLIARKRGYQSRRVEEDSRATGERGGTLFYCLKVAAP